MVEGKAEVAKKLVTMKFNKIVFTGSTEKGKLVASAAGKNLVPCILELGGKSPAVVDVGADPVGAANKILFGKMPNFGQVCISPDYILCHESQYDALLVALKSEYQLRYNSSEIDSGRIVN